MKRQITHYAGNTSFGTSSPANPALIKPDPFLKKEWGFFCKKAIHIGNKMNVKNKHYQ